MRLTWVPACAGTTLRSAGFRVSVFAFISWYLLRAVRRGAFNGAAQGSGLNPRPGAALPLGAAFSAGNARVSLKDALDGRPAVLVLADFKCRYTCGTALAIAADGLTQTGLEAGRDYNLLVIGINPGAGIADAEAMKAAYLAPYPRLQAAAKFLSGDAAAIASVTDALGYKAVYDAQRDEFAHPLGAVILTPEGRVSNVIEGLNLSAALLRPAILDARQSRLAAFVEGVRLLCYGRNPLEGAYTSTVQMALQGGALLTILGIGAALLFLGRRKGCTNMNWLRLLPEQASTQAPIIDGVYLLLTGVSAAIVALVVGLILTFSLRYRRGTGARRGPLREFVAREFEITWTAATFFLFFFLFWFTASAQFTTLVPPRDAMEVHVTGKQWMWKTQHGNGAREINTLHVPVNVPVRVVLTSEDVIHSFFVPAFRIKRDVLPGRYLETWFKATKTGTFHLFCTQFCGTQHSA